jgi:quinolinate synthase
MAMHWQQPLPAIYRELSDAELRFRIQEAKEKLGDELVILGHHYQQDDVIDFADHQGDSFELSQHAAGLRGVKYVVFCGVHFMAETADILTDPAVHVILPDMGAGCSMADMANIDQTLDAWYQMTEVCEDQTIVPITYMNSAADIKSFVGENGGAVCTSSNARTVLEWALAGGAVKGHADGKKTKVLFFPDQHLGRNTAAAMGYDPEKDMVVWDPRKDLGGNEEDKLRDATFVLWKGHCSVHALFRPEHVDEAREKFPEVKVLVHPECKKEVVDKADMAGSTAYIVKQVRGAEPGTSWAIGTEVHLVNRLKQQHPEQTIFVLSECQCLCTTMTRIDLPHLCYVLEELVAGNVVNEVAVDEETRKWSTVALDRMLELKGTGNPVGKDQPRATMVD